MLFCFCVFNDTATTEIYTYCHTLSLHDALPILILSLCIHAAILSIRVAAAPTPARQASTLEVVLVNASTKAAPIKPKLLAQHQINGGGNAAAGHAASPLPRTTDQTANEVVLAALRQRQEQLEQEQQRLFTQLQSKQKTLLIQKIGRASCRERGVSTCRSRWSPDH